MWIQSTRRVFTETSLACAVGESKDRKMIDTYLNISIILELIILCHRSARDLVCFFITFPSILSQV